MTEPVVVTPVAADAATPNVVATPPVGEARPATSKEDAGMRYQISREREGRIKAESERTEMEKQLKAPKPVFNDETDPDGHNEIDYKIQQGIRDGLKSHIKEL